MLDPYEGTLHKEAQCGIHVTIRGRCRVIPSYHIHTAVTIAV